MTEIQDHKYCEDTLKLKDVIENSFLMLGERLKKIKDEDMFKPQWDSWDEYLEEMKMSQATASKLINIYSKFVLEYGISTDILLESGGWSTLAELLPYAKSKEDANELIHEAGILTRKDLRVKLNERKSGIAQEECLHEFYELRICRKCQLKEKIYDDR